VGHLHNRAIICRDAKIRCVHVPLMSTSRWEPVYLYGNQALSAVELSGLPIGLSSVTMQRHASIACFMASLKAGHMVISHLVLTLHSISVHLTIPFDLRIIKFFGSNHLAPMEPNNPCHQLEDNANCSQDYEDNYVCPPPLVIWLQDMEPFKYVDDNDNYGGIPYCVMVYIPIWSNFLVLFWPEYYC